jgi:hypothetical protein
MPMGVTLSTELVVNTTPIGMNDGDPLPVAVDGCPGNVRG